MHEKVAAVLWQDGRRASYGHGVLGHGDLCRCCVVYIRSLDLPDHRPLAVTSDKPVCATEGQRKFVALDVVPPVVKAAVVAAEDPAFYRRPPVNPFIELATAVLSDVLFGAKPTRLLRGSPAISISVTRCLAMSGLAPNQRWPAGEWHIVNGVLLYRIEHDIPKDRILEIYLNEIWMGREVSGFAAASEFYFGKPLSDLSIAEVAWLAAMPRSPNQFMRGGDYALRLRDRALDRMAQAGAISATEAEEAKTQPLPVTSSTF